MSYPARTEGLVNMVRIHRRVQEFWRDLLSLRPPWRPTSRRLCEKLARRKIEKRRYWSLFLSGLWMQVLHFYIIYFLYYCSLFPRGDIRNKHYVSLRENVCSPMIQGAILVGASPSRFNQARQVNGKRSKTQIWSLDRRIRTLCIYLAIEKRYDIYRLGSVSGRDRR